jgi:hypothetical protein
MPTLSIADVCPNYEDPKPEVLGSLLNSEFVGDTVSQRSILHVNGIATWVTNGLGKPRPSRRILRSLEMGFQKRNVVFMDALLLKSFKRLEVVIGAAEFVVPHFSNNSSARACVRGEGRNCSSSSGEGPDARKSAISSMAPRVLDVLAMG